LSQSPSAPPAPCSHFPELAEQFIVLYGDTLLNVDLGRLWQTHGSRRADVTLFLHPNDHPYDSDLVAMDRESWITAFHPRPHPLHQYFPNLVNAALYVVNKSALEPWTNPAGPLDFAKDLFPAMLQKGVKLFVASPDIKDIGTPGRYDRVQPNMLPE
jgi:NDP-sugar pyrophosphorylase family protein